MHKVNSLSPMAIDFLLYSYFGIKNDDMEEDEFALKCAQRAYLDLCRTIEFNVELKAHKGIEEKFAKYIKKEFCNIISKLIADQIKEILLKDDQNFDSKHDEICKNLKTKASSIMFKKTDGEYEKVLAKDLTYGQVQKWLNITIKYLLLLDVWKDKFELVKDELHIPVDSFVMEAANKDENLNIDIPYKNKKAKGKYSENISKPWSDWEFDEYIEFQNSFKNCSRIEWETINWINIAEARKSDELEKLNEVVQNRVKVEIKE